LTATIRTVRFILLAILPSGSTFIQSVSFPTRKFIPVHIKEPIQCPIRPHEQPQDRVVRAIIGILQRVLRDVTMTFREHCLSNRPHLPEILIVILTMDPGDVDVFLNNPRFAMSFLGATPDEYREALDRAQRPPEAVAECVEGMTGEDLFG
jgi:hypothetical protein